MRRYGGLFEQLVGMGNLSWALRQAQQGKKDKANVATFVYFQEPELLQLQEELRNKTYKPGDYTTFLVYEKKKRLISAAPFRDRVVHHALCNIIEPIFERSFIYDTYANRRGKGTHRAVARCQAFAQKNSYLLKCDIQKYFPSIDHEILKGIIRRKIKDPDVLWLADLIIDHSNIQEEVIAYFAGDDLFTPLERRKGLPIGNQTSQFFANVYLNPLDHFLKETLGCRFYLRYVDDFLMFDDSKEVLWRMRDRVAKFLETLRLTIHPHKCHVSPVACGIRFLGYRVFPEYRLLPKENVRRFIRRMRKLQQKYRLRQVDLPRVSSSVNGWLGHALQADTYRLRRRLLPKFSFC